MVVIGLSAAVGLEPRATARAAEPLASPPSLPSPSEPVPEPEPAPPSAELDLMLAEAQALLAKKRYAQARVVLDEAYRLDPRPSLLWARAQAARWDSDCTAAIELYEQYIATGPTQVDQHRARANAERCRAELVESGIPVQLEEPEPEPELTPAPAPVPPPTITDDRPPRDAIGLASVITGASAFALGGGLLGLGAWTSARADEAPTEQDFGRRMVATRVELGLGGALAGVGLGLAIWGTVRLVRWKRTHASAPRDARGPGLARRRAQQGPAGSN